MEFGLTSDQKMMQKSIDRTLVRVAPLERVRKSVDEPFARDVFDALVGRPLTLTLSPTFVGARGIDGATHVTTFGSRGIPSPRSEMMFF